MMQRMALVGQFCAVAMNAVLDNAAAKHAGSTHLMQFTMPASV
jgi:hypothetical protein